MNKAQIDLSKIDVKQIEFKQNDPGPGEVKPDGLKQDGLNGHCGSCGGFNRIEVEYRLEKPAALELVYDDGTEEGKRDCFFLEAGGRTFGGLVPGYTEGAKFAGVRSALVRGFDGEDPGFILGSFMLETVPVLSTDTYYIENGRYKVGIRLIWGGGVNYIQDKRCPVPGIENLINQCDTGRLIQQSYYGTGETPENPDFYYGTFMNQKWVYNPVQGGDRGGLHSRLIDVRPGENSVWIKSQPKDWGKVGFDTKSYMENVYTLDGDLIRVDNRFVDFSGWKHPCRGQELPAFYTISYLDKFVWYDGTDSWTDAPLSSRSDLNFWGLPEYSASCRFRIRKSSTETWCAWVRESDDYGIGLFVPNVDQLYAGRHAYNGTKDPLDGATNYVAPLNRVQIVSFKPIEYSYLITTGSVDEIRGRFKENRDFAANESITDEAREYRTEDDAPPYGCK